LQGGLSSPPARFCRCLVIPLPVHTLIRTIDRTSSALPLQAPASMRHAMFVVAAVAPLAACAAPDSPAGLTPPLPSATLSILAPDSLRSLRLGDGVHYHFAWSAEGPWAIHLVSADLGRCEVGLRVVPALEGDGVTRARRSVTEMTPSATARVLAGVNGDFFAPDGTPVGPELTPTTRRSSPRPAFAWGPGRFPRIGPGAAVDMSQAGLHVVGGFPELLDGGRMTGDLGVAERPAFAAVRHPRTAIGLDSEQDRLWLAVVDGRQAPRSVGMSLPELVDLFLSLGADEALNLDGGGSSAMTLRGRLVSQPSDADGERRVGNSLWLVRDETACQRGR